LSISHNITISGPGPSALTITADGLSEVFAFTTAFSSLSGLVITGGSSGGGISDDGNLALNNCIVTQNIGWGINIANRSTVTIRDCIISSNVSMGLGGGLHSNGTVTLIRTTVTGNQVRSNLADNTALGGGIGNNGFMTIEDSVVSGNLALGFSGSSGSEAHGGGIGSRGSLTIVRSTISGNTAQAGDADPGRQAMGGGIANESGGELTVIGSTIDHNTALGGACHSTATGGNGLGGGVETDLNGSATFTNSTIFANTARGGDSDGGTGGGAVGGGVDGNSQLTLTNCTIVQNGAFEGFSNQGQPQTLAGGIEWNAASNSVVNCIVAGNAALLAPDSSPFNTGTAVFNLIGDGTSSNFTNGSNGNQVGTTAAPIDPKLGPLQFNGGRTKTCALLPGSPAIDAGTNNGVTFTTDQRGFDRFANGTTDIGAFEYQPIHLVAVGAGLGMAPEVKVYDPTTGTLKLDFLAYEPTFRGGVRVAVADMNGDGVPDIIAAPGGVNVTLVPVNGALMPNFDFSAGRAPEIKVFSGADGSLLADFLAYDPSFTAGVFVAVGAIDGKPDIITAPDATGQAGHTNVRVFFHDSLINTGAALAPNREFNAYDPGFGGGVRIAAGDINGDGTPDIITAPGIWSGPDIRVFNGKDLAVGTPPGMIGEILAYDFRYFGGVFVATGDVNGDGRTDIITGTNGNGGPEVKAFNGATVGIGTPPPQVLDDFFAYDPAFNGGSTVALVDVNGDGRADIVTGAGPGGGPHVRIFEGGTGLQLTDAFDSFMAFDPTFSGGVYVGGA
jgi:hypothetical protein